MEFGVLLRLVCLTNFSFILSRPSNMRHRKPFLCDLVEREKKELEDHAILATCRLVNPEREVSLDDSVQHTFYIGLRPDTPK